jgi:DASS family divalent anion:Na+ symporter
MAPEVTSTPDAPAAARRALAALGPLSRSERIVALTFVGMVGLWASAAFIGLDSTAVVFSASAFCLRTGVLTPGDIAKEGDVLATFIWFAVLYTLSGQTERDGLHGLPGAAPGGCARAAWARSRAYRDPVVVIHRAALFVRESDSARDGAVRGVPGSRHQARRAAAPLAFMLLFASNFFSVIAPQGSSANLLFAGSGYLTQRELYRLGALTTAVSFLIYLVIATPWLILTQ